jgi:hypothetical protein
MGKKDVFDFSDIRSESGSAEGRSPLPGTLPGGQVIGGFPRKSFFLSSPPQAASSEGMSDFSLDL